MGAAARRVAERYSWDVAAGQYLRLYQERRPCLPREKIPVRRVEA
jgi:hypothetical protein